MSYMPNINPDYVDKLYLVKYSDKAKQCIKRMFRVPSCEGIEIGWNLVKNRKMTFKRLFLVTDKKIYFGNTNRKYKLPKVICLSDVERAEYDGFNYFKISIMSNKHNVLRIPVDYFFDYKSGPSLNYEQKNFLFYIAECLNGIIP